MVILFMIKCHFGRVNMKIMSLNTQNRHEMENSGLASYERDNWERVISRRFYAIFKKSVR